MEIISCNSLFFCKTACTAGSEVSALLGRMPSAVGYQPTLATEMGAMQERNSVISSSKSFPSRVRSPTPANTE